MIMNRTNESSRLFTVGWILEPTAEWEKWPFIFTRPWIDSFGRTNDPYRGYAIRAIILQLVYKRSERKPAKTVIKWYHHTGEIKKRQKIPSEKLNDLMTAWANMGYAVELTKECWS